jgi:UPF0176 protein
MIGFLPNILCIVSIKQLSCKYYKTASPQFLENAKIQLMSKNFKIILYYKYVPIKNPIQLQIEQKTLCQKLNLKGRILISEEGINGTAAGDEASINEYMRQTQAVPELRDLEWKISWADEQVFPKLRVVVRDEIVTLGIKKTGTDVKISNKADYIPPTELKELYESGDDFVILDARNAYEAEIGRFKNALIPPIDNFREFPEFVENNLQDYKDKNIVTYCTGGVRCEKASAYLREIGFKKVRQLHGGVHEYGEQTGGKYFEGELFVFDKRLHMPVNEADPSTISECLYCKKAITRFVDCHAFGCGTLFICCAECEKSHKGACSQQCEKHIPEASAPETSHLACAKTFI